LDTGQLFAIKVIDKQLMIERDKEEIIFNERNILTRIRHKRIVRMHYAFQTVPFLVVV
jgi:serum/glucocorticoid-regulated kinase 2